MRLCDLKQEIRPIPGTVCQNDDYCDGVRGRLKDPTLATVKDIKYVLDNGNKCNDVWGPTSLKQKEDKLGCNRYVFKDNKSNRYKKCRNITSRGKRIGCSGSSTIFNSIKSCSREKKKSGTISKETRIVQRNF